MGRSRAASGGKQKPRPVRRGPVDYAPAALPERQPAIAMLVPTGLGGLTACAAVVVLGLAAMLAAGLYEPALAAASRAAGPRFARSIAVLAACVDPRATLSLATWLSHLLLLGGAAVALAVGSMRRHRRDDRRGRHRAWGWMACLLVAASCATQVPLGRLAGTLASEATGLTFGPAGLGWWVTIAGALLSVVSLWAVLPLYERGATALWMTAGLAAWGVCSAAMWLGTTRSVHPGIAPGAWTAGCGLVAIAMLAAARSVIREARGEAAARARAGASKAPAAADRPDGRATEPEADDERSDGDGWSSESTDATVYTDGSEFDQDQDTRHLSKAERKRLKKLARMSRAA